VYIFKFFFNIRGRSSGFCPLFFTFFSDILRASGAGRKARRGGVGGASRMHQSWQEGEMPRGYRAQANRINVCQKGGHTLWIRKKHKKKPDPNGPSSLFLETTRGFFFQDSKDFESISSINLFRNLFLFLTVCFLVCLII